MENISQIKDNAATFNNLKPLTKEEREIIAKAVDLINSIPRIPCTTCRYCVPHCPKKIQIPTFIGIYNTYLVHKQKSSSGYQYAWQSHDGVSPTECVKCGECEKHCPQNIKISDVLEKLVDALDNIREDYIIDSN